MLLLSIDPYAGGLSRAKIILIVVGSIFVGFVVITAIVLGIVLPLTLRRSSLTSHTTSPPSIGPSSTSFSSTSSSNSSNFHIFKADIYRMYYIMYRIRIF